jgi:hypothetical protein
LKESLQNIYEATKKSLKETLEELSFLGIVIPEKKG